MAESDLIRGNVDTIILKVLYEGDRYGYDLIRQINARSDGQWEIKQPTVYACLKRLEKQGFITSYWDSSESDGGRRKYYSLTESGREVFLKYKSEFERANALFGGLISGSEPTVFIQPTDDYSDVEEEGYSLPKRKPKRAPKKQAEDKDDKKAEQKNEAAADTPIQPIVQEQPEQPAQPVTPTEPAAEQEEKKTAAQTLFELAEQQQVKQDVPVTKKEKPTEAREALDPKLIIEQYFAAETGESYSDIQRKNTFSSAEPIASAERKVVVPPPARTEQKPVAPAPAPVQPKQPAQTAPVQPAPARPAQPTLPTPTPDRPMLVPAAIPGFESSPALSEQKAAAPAVGFAAEESPARREYKTVLEDLVDRFEVATPDIRTTATTATQEQAATAELAENRQLGKVEQAVRELGNDVTIRNHNNSAKEYTGKNFYYCNRLMMTHYTIMCATMFLVGLILFLTFRMGLGMTMQYDYALYICAGLLPIFMFITAVICYANNPDKTKRININFKFSLIIRFVIMLQVDVIVYCMNLMFNMPITFSLYYVPSIVLPCAYALFIPISEIIFITLLRSGKYSDTTK
ncbi:MAG: helix-turn-helix transcriptional regulator [Clostridiales bacterium]|nr:helix-turn-helix transcriptional regulator [Clostridiales bacterium]